MAITLFVLYPVSTLTPTAFHFFLWPFGWWINCYCNLLCPLLLPYKWPCGKTVSISKIVRLNSIFASRFSNFKLSQLWNNICSLVLVQTKCNTPNINGDALNNSFINDPTDTPVRLPPPFLNPSAFKPASNSDIWPLLHRANLNSTERCLGIPPLILRKVSKRAMFLRHWHH